ncbi:MAG: hypothetical protein MJ123_10205 [Lachnospiraceae bacterium]|nr:hypothetical protein [Lachnospiraceae bacterium]
MALRDEIKEQQKTLKGKSFKYKWEYFLEYYKWATIAVIIAAIAIFSFIKGVVTAKHDAFYAICVNAITMPSSDAFSEYIEIDTKKEKVVFDTTYSMIDEGGNQNSYLSLQKMVANIAAGTADVIIGDLDVLQTLAPNEFFADLRNYFSEDELNALGDKVIYSQLKDDDGNLIGEEIPLIINVTDSPLLNSYPFFVYDEGFGIIANTSRPERCKKFYNFLYDEAILEKAKEPMQPYG